MKLFLVYPKYFCKQRLAFFRHIIRANNLEKRFILGKIEEGRPAMSWLEGVKKAIGRSLDELLLPSALHMFLVASLHKSENDREKVSQLLLLLRNRTLIPNTSAILEGFKGMLASVEGLEEEVPRVKSLAAGLMARAVGEQLCPLSQLMEPLEGGALYPLSLLCLQALHRAKGPTWLEDTCNQARLNLLPLLPEKDRSPEHLADILEERDLGFLSPLLRIQTDLWRQLQADPGPSVLYRWIKDHVDAKLHNTAGFINILLLSIDKRVCCSLLKYITMETTLAEGADTNTQPDKTALEREKEFLEKFKPVFQAFLNEHPDLQLVALYSLQVHCYNWGFPKDIAPEHILTCIRLTKQDLWERPLLIIKQLEEHELMEFV
ncbi:EIF4G2 [Cordylochernes scorpioides]|uniref:EIF4G2 n=1 Tax=Cordylochernes scorpioides TaxID=51811 RepID=A0ABY6LJN3_9ARAC|nr:EIF4G2 [Cordylochernes scorpioides]